MRHRPINYKKDNPEIFKKLVKNNHYIAKVYNYPNILDPHPTYEKFRKIKDKFKIDFTIITHIQLLRKYFHRNYDILKRYPALLLRHW